MGFDINDLDFSQGHQWMHDVIKQILGTNTWKEVLCWKRDTLNEPCPKSETNSSQWEWQLGSLPEHIHTEQFIKQVV